MAAVVAVGLLRERLEQARQERLRDAAPGVAHADGEKVFLGVDADGHLAALGELDAVADEVHHHAAHRRGGLRGDVFHGVRREVERQATLLGERPQQLHRRARLGDDVERLGDERLGVGVQAGVVEDVVEGAEQPRGARVDGLGELLEVVRDLLAQDVREAQDGRQRRADLVAHVGQDGALELGGRLGLGARRLGGLHRLEQPELVVAPLGDVARDRDEHLVAVEVEVPRRELERDARVVLAADLEHRRGRAQAVRLGEVVGRLVGVRREGRQERHRPVGPRPVGADAEGAPRRAVGLEHAGALAGVEDEHGVRDGVEQVAVAALRDAEPLGLEARHAPHHQAPQQGDAQQRPDDAGRPAVHRRRHAHALDVRGGDRVDDVSAVEGLRQVVLGRHAAHADVVPHLEAGQRERRRAPRVDKHLDERLAAEDQHDVAGRAGARGHAVDLDHVALDLDELALELLQVGVLLGQHLGREQAGRAGHALHRRRHDLRHAVAERERAVDEHAVARDHQGRVDGQEQAQAARAVLEVDLVEVGAEHPAAGRDAACDEHLGVGPEAVRDEVPVGVGQDLADGLQRAAPVRGDRLGALRRRAGGGGLGVGARRSQPDGERGAEADREKAVEHGRRHGGRRVSAARRLPSTPARRGAISASRGNATVPTRAPEGVTRSGVSLPAGAASRAPREGAEPPPAPAVPSQTPTFRFHG